jgi:hypothetical protein
MQFLLSPDQLFSLMAATIVAQNPETSAEDAVLKSIDIVAYAGIHTNASTLQKRVVELSPGFMEEQAAKQQAAQRGLLVPGGPIDPNLLKRNRRQEA